MLGGDAAVQFVCLYHLNIRHLSLEMGIAGLCRQFHAFTAKQGTHAVFRNGWEHGEGIVVRLLRFGLLIDGFSDFLSQAVAYQDGDSALTQEFFLQQSLLRRLVILCQSKPFIQEFLFCLLIEILERA